MTVSFVPGEPNKTAQAVAQAVWRTHSIVAYCSGNNLIILTDDMKFLQTVYLDTDAAAVGINSCNGNIAVAVGAQVHIYEPMNQFMKSPRWSFCSKLVNEDDNSLINALSWGVEEELVTASDRLTLWCITREYGTIQTSIHWSMIQASPVYLLAFSEDSSLIASCGKYDTILKVWNRIVFGENSLFDLVYLLHPSSITKIRWKRTDPEATSGSESYTNTLYSLASDAILRIWSSYEHENSHLIQHWGSLNLYEKECDKFGRRFALIIDDYLVKNAIKGELEKKYNEELIELRQKQPDIAIIASEDGTFTVYAIENLAENPPKLINVSKLKTLKFVNKVFVKNPMFLNFAEPIIYDNGQFSIVIHDLNGVIRHSILNLDFLVSSDSITEAGVLAHKLTGHNKSIQKVIRTSDGETMLTISRFQENCLWRPQYLKESITLNKQSVIKTPAPIEAAVLLDSGNLMVCLCGNNLLLWNTSTKIAQLKFKFTLDNNGDGIPLCFARIPLQNYDSRKHYLIAVYKTLTRAWIVKGSSIEVLDTENLTTSEDDIDIISTIDPVGPDAESNRVLLSTITSGGLLTCFYAKIEGNKIYFCESSRLETDIRNPSYIRGSSIYKFAVIDQTCKKLTIWDLKRNVLEYEELFDREIQDIDWTSTKYKQSILAVGFNDYSILYTQLRYDYTNSNPTFLPIRKVDIRDYTTHNIGDSLWLKDGILVVGAGNQMFIADKTLDLVEDKFARQSVGSRNIVSNDILNLCSVLNGPLPLYHPQILIQSLFMEKLSLVKELLLRLFLKIRELENTSTSIDHIGIFLGFDIRRFWELDYVDSSKFEEPYTEFNSSVADLLKEKLMSISLPYLTRHQQITLVSTIEAVVHMDKNRLFLDENGLRFCLGVKLYQLHARTQEKLTMRDINWALHSENKELLLQLIESSVKDNKITFNVAREYGLAYWLKFEDLVTTFENIAKNEFNKDNRRDPINCSIFYLALHKKNILLGLWRTAVGHPEQQKMLNFLKNDFSEKRWRSAALKNAFVLLSKHRYFYAASFFLLADSLNDSVNVLVKQVRDIDLAIAVCRVYEGDNGPVLYDLLLRHILPEAVKQGDRWTSSFVHWKRKERATAIQALVKSPCDLLSQEELNSLETSELSKSFLEDDPLLVILYQNLREKNIIYYEGSLNIDIKHEFAFIFRIASIYTRMGCDYLSVHLLNNWKFLKIDEFKRTKSTITEVLLPTAPLEHNGNIMEKYGFSSNSTRRINGVSKLQKDENSNKVSILEKYGLASKPSAENDNENNPAPSKTNIKKPPSAAFQEPDMSSFDFGF